MKKKPWGFTLIELSIVLVIIGLVVGGVLAGKELIESSKLRKQVSQFQQISTGFNMFKVKYNYLPGDMPTAAAAGFGLPRDLSGWGSSMNGDGTIRGHTGAYGVLLVEAMWVFPQLSAAQMIPGIYYNPGYDAQGQSDPSSISRAVMPGTDFPATIINPDVGLLIYTDMNWGNSFLVCPSAIGNGGLLLRVVRSGMPQSCPHTNGNVSDGSENGRWYPVLRYIQSHKVRHGRYKRMGSQ